MFRFEGEALVRRSVYPLGIVHCQKCNTPIQIAKPNNIAQEFSVSCKKCGRRSFYSSRTLQIEEMPERRRKSRG